MINNKLLLFCITFEFAILALGYESLEAQVIPDRTLGVENSQVIPGDSSNGLLNEQIDGGAIRGSTLFHSFQEFNVGEGRGIYFTNPTGIENILSRVTGANPSNILGRLGVIGGNANLLLINPNGIIFGSNASLDINSSFLGSTANSIELSGGIQFDAKNPQPVPLLSIEVPIGLGFGKKPAPIRVEGTGHKLSLFFPLAGSPILGSGESLNGLRTDTGKTIALVGGDVNFDGGILTASSGRIEIGSVNSGVVEINSTASGIFLNYGRLTNFQDIKLDKKALLDTSGFANGSISLRAKNIDLTNGSFILVSNFGSIDSSSVTLNATEDLTMNLNLATLGNSRIDGLGAGIVSQNFSSGKGADITISARQLDIETAFGIVTETYGQGLGGNISLNIYGNSLQNLDESTSQISVDRSLVATFVSTNATGNAGNLKVFTDQLFIKDGGTIASESFGLGNGGNVNIVATESIKVSGSVKVPFPFNSFVPSFLGALATSQGNAGDVSINTNQLILESGGRLDSTTLASGSAGKVSIVATDSVDVSGRVSDSLNPTLISSSANRVDPAFTPFYGLSNALTGNSGSVEITTNQLNINDGARVSVRNDGSGEAGDLKVIANSINLRNQGAIAADTAKGTGGDITLRTDALQLRQNSQINATAGGNSTGGNITIDTNTLVALENSDITANAFEGRGGNIAITAKGIFGIESRTRLTPLSDITASSALGINGTVQINTLDTNPTNGLVSLPPTVVDSSRLIAQDCSAREDSLAREKSEFIITGRGGLPPQPNEPLRAEAIAIAESGEENRSANVTVTRPISSTSTQIVEAQGWVLNERGQVILTAQPVSATPTSSRSTQVTCYAP
ncbi:filamentous hemagglutinin N-terminal domain-containing protein [Synechocystis sp. PCC 7509]|uniref:two-partner secretion domain-containing protein n=1 Tax=Synechocystis sp. PCC 7509 TaxID=927677 RepID=UPI000686767C|nr:filamentous hemagglutinin N-terminal domain-containing protein [Synechocystis sp. PCC 7509]